jgi:hypothetical protein
MYLLRYKREGEWRVVVIAEAYSVAHARMVAAGLAPWAACSPSGI